LVWLQHRQLRKKGNHDQLDNTELSVAVRMTEPEASRGVAFGIGTIVEKTYEMPEQYTRAGNEKSEPVRPAAVILGDLDTPAASKRLRFGPISSAAATAAERPRQEPISQNWRRLTHKAWHISLTEIAPINQALAAIL